MLPIEYDRSWRRVIQSYHDSVIHVPGVTRSDRDGNEIRPLGMKEAAHIAGLTPTDMSNRVNPNMPEHRPTLEGFVLHLLSGMDTSALDEIESAIGRVAITVPEIGSHDDLLRELLDCIKEFGDIGESIRQAQSKHSDGGIRITRREARSIRHEIEDEVAQLYELLAAIEEVAT